jgi:hypothetical protein
MNNNAFTFPTVNGTVAVTTTSQRVAMQGSGGSLVLKNVGGTECFVAVGNSTVTATAGTSATDETDGSFSIPAGEVGSYSIPVTATHVAAVTASGTTTLRVSRGEGA